MSKQKGAAFELHVVKLIRKVVSKRFGDDICYRTPCSGGHPSIGGGDIIIKRALKNIFPFDIECKHRKTIKVHKFFAVSKEMTEYLKQTLENCYESDDYPMLIIRGTATPIFCISQINALQASEYEILSKSDIPGLLFKFRGKTWKIFLIEHLLKELKNKIEKMKNPKFKNS